MATTVIAADTTKPAINHLILLSISEQTSQNAHIYNQTANRRFREQLRANLIMGLVLFTALFGSLYWCSLLHTTGQTRAARVLICQNVEAH